MMKKIFISVILPLKLEWEPCYYVLCDKITHVCVGDRVRVNFAGRNYLSVVSGVGIKPTTDLSKIKEAVFDDVAMEPVLPTEIEFWRQVSDYYMCTIGEVYKAAYPAGKTNLEEALAARRLRDYGRKQRQIADLEEKLAKYPSKYLMMESRLLSKERQINRAVKQESKARYISEREKLISDMNELSHKQEQLRLYISNLKETQNDWMDSHLIKQISFDSGTSIKDANLIERYSKSNLCNVQLTDAQSVAYRQIKEGFSLGKPVMLHGVTGAGKTEIYLKLASEVIARGQNVLYLVPEIALSRQLENRLGEYFHNNLFIFHSGQSAVQKRDIADRIRNISKDKNKSTDISTNSYIVLGTRSALFLPHNNLGLIIIDEEHDSSYKQDSPAPRYNGRDAALMLSQLQTRLQEQSISAVNPYNSASEGLSSVNRQSCNIILGSATPSLEEVYNCATGRHMLVKLSERFHGADDSDVEIIDTKAERRKNGMVGSFSRKLIFKINSVLQDGGQVMILRSRRAWSTAMQCSECGEIVKCPHCNVSLSLHGRPENGKLVCHYCGYSRFFDDKCIKCGSHLVPLCTGTQRIEEEVARLFPDCRVARLDSDSAKNKKYEIQTIRDFSSGNIDILVGTQIVAKGFDFSNLRLVAVIAADSLMSIQDFRADEKTLQLLEQFRGRCGRRGKKGMFVIQTSQSEHPIFQRIVQGETDLYTVGLLQERKDFGFPPYSRIVEIQVKNRVLDRALTTAEKLAQVIRLQLNPIYGNSLEVVTGPYTPVPDKLADYYLQMVRVSLKKDKNLAQSKSIIRTIVIQLEKQFDSIMTINVDPS